MNDVVNDYYRKYGVNLSEYGVNGYIFDKDKALRFLDIAKKESLIVLGGDLYKKESDKYILTYDNWFFEGSGADLEHKVDKSIELAKDKVIEFSNKSENFYFLLVIGV